MTPLMGIMSGMGASKARVPVSSGGGGGGGGATYPTTFDRYISPTGSNANNGLTSSTPWKTFAFAFATMSAGQRLGMLDGTYSEAAGTGSIYYVGTFSSNSIPNGTSKSNMTEICSVNPGGAVITDPVFLGRSTRKDSYIKLRGLKMLGAFAAYNTSYVYVKDSGIRGAFGIGTNDESGGATISNSYALFEDCWIWAYAERLIAANYQAHNCIWRRVVVRGDGGGPSGSGNPNVGITVYNSEGCALQNVIVVDRIVTGSQPYADFATAQHDGTAPDIALYKFGNNEWDGCLSIASQDASFHFEIDDARASVPTWTVRNLYGNDFNISPGGSGTANTLASCFVSGLTILDGGQIRIRDMPIASVCKDSIVANGVSFGMNGNGSLTCSYLDTYNNSSGNNISISPGALTFNPLSGSPASVKYPTRIETGSLAKGAGSSGADVGCTALFRVGTDGTFRDDAGYNTVTAVPLWPWPNEARIKTDMAAAYSSVATTRGFCTTGLQLDGATPVTLTSYIWESRGNQMPAGVY